MSHGFYMSLDEARRELHRRWNDVGLRSAIESALGQHFMELFRDFARAILPRHLISPTMASCCSTIAQNIWAPAVRLEYLGDCFNSLNEEKMGSSRPRVFVGANKFQLRLFNIKQWEKQPLREIVLATGETLASFHHGLFDRLGLHVEILDQTACYRAIGKPVDYYYPLFAHAVAHGVLFETFVTDDEPVNRLQRKTEHWFTDEVVRPIFERVTRDFGLRPMVVAPSPTTRPTMRISTGGATRPSSTTISSITHDAIS